MFKASWRSSGSGMLGSVRFSVGSGISEISGAAPSTVGIGGGGGF